MLTTLSLILGLIALHFFFVWTGCTPVRAFLSTVLCFALGGLIVGAVVEVQNLLVEVGAELHKHSPAQTNNRSFEVQKKKWAHVHVLLIQEWKAFFKFVGEVHKEAFQQKMKSKLACELCKDRAGSNYEDSFLRSRYWAEGVEFSKAQTQCYRESMLLGVNKLRELVSLWAK